jgi:hypothetical protein
VSGQPAPIGSARNWDTWHQRYDDPASSQARRLGAVVSLLVAALDQAPPGPIRVLSLCAGEARDLQRALTDHPRSLDVIGLVVEADPALTRRAATNLAPLGPGLVALCGDAGDPATFGPALPADVLLLCGIFGNVAVADIATTVDAVPTLCRPGSQVLWTRHRLHPDITPWIRQRFHDAGCPALSLLTSGPGGYAVGRQRVTSAMPGPPPALLFTFTSTAEAWTRPGAGRPPMAGAGLLPFG